MNFATFGLVENKMAYLRRKHSHRLKMILAIQALTLPTNFHQISNFRRSRVDATDRRKWTAKIASVSNKLIFLHNTHKENSILINQKLNNFGKQTRDEQKRRRMNVQYKLNKETKWQKRIKKEEERKKYTECRYPLEYPLLRNRM